MKSQIKTNSVIEPDVLFEAIQNGNREKVGILGGTFNPPHLGHLIIANQVMDQLDLDTILFLPSAIPPHSSGKETIDPSYRVEMVKRAIEDYPAFQLELSEIERGGKSYTFDTIKSLIDNNPSRDYYFIIGADMVADLPTWHRVDELVNLVQMVGVSRPGFEVETDYPVIWVDINSIDVSSSDIRQKVNNQCSIKFVVPDKVIEYIEKEGLYKDE